MNASLPTTQSGQIAWLIREVRRLTRSGGGSGAMLCTQRSASYTLTTSDNYTCVEFTGSSGQTCTVPANSTESFPVGAWVEVRQFGTGQVTFAAAGGVTLRSANSAVKTCSQYTTCVLHQRAVDDWVLVGDLV